MFGFVRGMSRRCVERPRRYQGGLLKFRAVDQVSGRCTIVRTTIRSVKSFRTKDKGFVAFLVEEWSRDVVAQSNCELIIVAEGLSL